MGSVGILAYGSLIEEPGKKLGPLARGRLEGLETPFPVEFARSSSSRDGAPTIVPVENGGARVRAIILVLDPAVSVEQAEDLLWRRETTNECNDRHYSLPPNPGPNSVVIKHLNGFGSVETVLYTSINANIKNRTPEQLADLAICSARRKAGACRKDGISYLISVKRNGIKTPLMADYEAAILQKTGATTLEEALKRIRKGDT